MIQPFVIRGLSLREIVAAGQAASLENVHTYTYMHMRAPVEIQYQITVGPAFGGNLAGAIPDEVAAASAPLSRVEGLYILTTTLQSGRRAEASWGVAKASQGIAMRD